MALNSSSQNVKWISNMGYFGTYSIMGGNIRLLIEKYDMNVKNVVKAWNEIISKNEELVRVCEQVTEVVGIRDRYIGSVMSQSECDDILTFVCTGQGWDHEIFYFIFCTCTYANKEFQTN